MAEKKKPAKRKARVWMSAAKLKEARAYVGVSQQALANAVGVHQVTVAKWEAKPRPSDLEEFFIARRHHGMDRAWAMLVQKALRDLAQAYGKPIEPLEIIFSSNKTTT